jgi:hypothetical protein
MQICAIRIQTIQYFLLNLANLQQTLLHQNQINNFHEKKLFLY